MHVGSSWCPRCGAELTPPSAYSSSWRCALHGAALPLRAYHRLDVADLDHLRSNAEVPFWVPEPMPLGWTLTGMAAVGDGRSRLRATVSAWTGPAPLGGQGQWLVVAEEPGIGLGASYAMAAEPADSDIGSPGHRMPTSRIHTLGRPTPLWAAESAADDRSAYVGEAAGVWLWVVSFPADAGYAVLDDVGLADARQGLTPILPTSAAPNRLRPGVHDGQPG